MLTGRSIDAVEKSRHIDQLCAVLHEVEIQCFCIEPTINLLRHLLCLEYIYVKLHNYLQN